MSLIVSHEAPLSMLEASRFFNDYDYALVHLFSENKEYLNFFKESLRRGRTVYLDNSLFELETMFDHAEFAKWVIELGSINPDNFYYIIPDILEEKDATISSAGAFLRNYPDLPGKTIGVVQGKNKLELFECYEYMADNVDRVAISFDYSFYNELYPNAENKYQAWASGRRWLMQHLAQANMLKDAKDGIHLLGCGVPQEFRYYSTPTFENVVSVDTSNPVVHGIKKIKYTNMGLNSKESIKLVDLFDTIPDKEQLECVFFNVKKFKEFTS